MSTPSKTRPRAEAIGALRRLQQELTESWIDRSLPEGWHGLDMRAPVPAPKTRVTLRLDSDMLKWFRKLGPGYQARINDVLRVYWTALLAGLVKSHWDEDAVSPNFEALVLRMAEADLPGEDDDTHDHGGDHGDAWR